VPPVNAPGTIGLDTPTDEFASVYDCHCVHASLRGEGGCQVGRRAARTAAARYPEDEPLPLFPQIRQHRAIDSLCAQHIDVVKLGELLGSKGSCRPADHAASVLDQHVDTALLLDNGLNLVVRERRLALFHSGPEALSCQNIKLEIV
jgi:hypothetical protein